MLFVGQPALSRQIKELEDALGFPIFLRNREGLHLTPAGQIVLTFAQEALKTRMETIKAARAMSRGEVQPLKLGFSSFAPPEVLQEFCADYSALLPECEIQLVGNDPANILRKLEQQIFDAAVLPLPVNDGEWTIEPIVSHDLVVCMRSDDPLADVAAVKPEEMAARLRIFRDPFILRLIGKWLKAGYMVGGDVLRTEEGSPQGGLITPRTQSITISSLSGRLSSSAARGTDNDTPATLDLCLLWLYLYGICLALLPHKGRNGSILPAYCFSVVGHFPKLFSDLRRHVPSRLVRHIGISSRRSS